MLINIAIAFYILGTLTWSYFYKVIEILYKWAWNNSPAKLRKACFIYRWRKRGLPKDQLQAYIRRVESKARSGV